MRLSKVLAKQSGYVALMATLIISAALLGLTITVSSAGFFTRASILEDEYKQNSLVLANSCANTALLALALNFNYQPSDSNKTISVNSDSCVIDSVTQDQQNIELKTITVHAQYREAFTNLIITAAVQNPSQLPPSPLPPNIAITSWEEVP